jgi:hypothetical protein
MKTGVPDDLGPPDPGLDALISTLTSGATADELAGEPAALAMFRASLPKAPAPARQRRRRVLRLAGAAALVLAGGFAAAAYAAVLPTPIQHVAYRALGFVGVPAARPAPPRPATSHPAPPPAGHGTSPVPGRSSQHPASPAPSRADSRTASPAPRPSSPAAPLVPATLSLTAAQHRIAAGGSDSLTGVLLTAQARPVPGQQVTLLERASGQGKWVPAGHAATGADGSAVITITNLTGNAVFRLVGPDGTRSRPVLVIAVPPVSVTVGSGPQPKADTLTVSSPLAAAGDLVVLQIQDGGSWRTLHGRQLSPAGQAAFVVKLRPLRHVYRVALAATARHGAAVSSPVAVAPARG